jgi:hypothetical protein
MGAGKRSRLLKPPLNKLVLVATLCRFSGKNAFSEQEQLHDSSHIPHNFANQKPGWIENCPRWEFI